ncbi:MAG: hypothetical protein PHY54_02610 [Methylococcales bacterium]|nr:hypothetical protein [Methylococcales bacterium]
MKQIFIQGLLPAILALGLNHQALAHVDYTDITNLGSTGFTASGYTTYGWNQGQIQPGPSVPANNLDTAVAPPYFAGALASTDDVVWYKFTLTSPEDITLKITNSGIAAANNPLAAIGFSLYSGTVVSQSFDVTGINGYTTVTPNTPASQNTAGVYPDERGLVNTAGSFSLTTAAGTIAQRIANERTLNFITSATDGGTGTAQLVNYLLGPGDYSVVAGGNSAWNVDQEGLANSTATVMFSAVPVSAVPVPAAFWLMGSALAGFGFFGQRKHRLAA